jgi:DNA-directed RNA polymerase specialized sigma24 family protein
MDMVGSRVERGVVHQLEKLFGHGTVTGLSEEQLLDRFATARDESAFEALVERHGPMVLGVCRQFLRDPNDVEDAFQATFLVLVRKAGSLRQKDLLGNWLYGVACRVALRSRTVGIRRRIRVSLG